MRNIFRRDKIAGLPALLRAMQGHAAQRAFSNATKRQGGLLDLREESLVVWSRHGESFTHGAPSSCGREISVLISLSHCLQANEADSVFTFQGGLFPLCLQAECEKPNRLFCVLRYCSPDDKAMRHDPAADKNRVALTHKPARRTSTGTTGTEHMVDTANSPRTGALEIECRQRCNSYKAGKRAGQPLGLCYD